MACHEEVSTQPGLTQGLLNFQCKNGHWICYWCDFVPCSRRCHILPELCYHSWDLVPSPREHEAWSVQVVGTPRCRMSEWRPRQVSEMAIDPFNYSHNPHRREWRRLSQKAIAVVFAQIPFQTVLPIGLRWKRVITNGQMSHSRPPSQAKEKQRRWLQRRVQWILV